MNKKERTTEILKRMDEHYGTDLVCYLEHEDPWQLLIATILSAQCTDARVNMVTPELFRRYPTPKDLGEAKLADVEEVIHSVGFYHNKAKNIIACSRKLWEEYGGTVPHEIELLTELPGVGRKTANVIRGNIFHEPSIVVDTHVGRISRRLGLTKETEPVKVEYALMKELPKDHWILWNLQGIALGREICKAPTPNCSECFLKDICRGCGKKVK
ncbi:MAG: endonuclease III [Lachnospiraceae bacterium]|nr:endonuclease III [Lachnospiraceae bacterium]